jgi:microcystin-dependent protein
MKAALRLLTLLAAGTCSSVQGQPTACANKAKMNPIKPLLNFLPSAAVFAVLAVVATHLPLSSRAQSVPPMINYQGRLANPDGSPFPTADYELRVSIYDAASNGIRVWGPQVFDGTSGLGHGPRIPVLQGYFNVMLGSVDTNGRSLLNAFGSSNRFVEVTVSNRPPISPRQQILSTPYSMEAGNGSPPGSIVAFGGDPLRVPNGWLLCDGRPVVRAVFHRLFEAIDTFWGHGDGSSTFNLPDLRGYFLRGVDSTPSADRDPEYASRTALKPGGNTGRNVGSYQPDELRLHSHPLNVYTYPAGGTGGGDIIRASPTSDQRMALPAGGSETRPKNVYVNYIIKY